MTEISCKSSKVRIFCCFKFSLFCCFHFYCFCSNSNPSSYWVYIANFIYNIFSNCPNYITEKLNPRLHTVLITRLAPSHFYPLKSILLVKQVFYRLCRSFVNHLRHGHMGIYCMYPYEIGWVACVTTHLCTILQRGRPVQDVTSSTMSGKTPRYSSACITSSAYFSFL